MKQAMLRAYSLLIRATFALSPGISWGRRIRLKGLPILDAREGGRIELEDDLTLNSRNFGYHINMHGPVKIVADRPGAIVRVGSGTRINGACLHAYDSIIVGKRCLIAANTNIIDGSGHDLSFENVTARINTKGNAKPIVLGDDVWIGANCLILPGVTIGTGAVVAAGSVVTRDVPAMSVVAGNPAVVVKRHEASAI